MSQMAFFAHVSDPALGGTYMTLLNTMGNLGGRWPPTAAFFMVDAGTPKAFKTRERHEALTCQDDSCMLKMDGFYSVTLLPPGPCGL